MQTLDLSPRDFVAIQKLLQKRSAKLPLTKLWRRVCDEYGIGSISVDERHIGFNAADREQLRKVVFRETSFDPLTDELPDFAKSDRVALAGFSSNEKIGRRAVGAGRVLVTSASGRLLVDGEYFSVPKGTGLWLDWRRIGRPQGEPIIVVENEAAFNAWHCFRLPEPLRSCAAVYRGHDSAAVATNEWVDSLTKDELIGAYDFDPAGLAMAKQCGVGQILVPADPGEFLGTSTQNSPALDKSSAFLQQHQQHASNRLWVSGEIKGAWRWMDEHGSSITQEAMASTAALMRLIPLCIE